MLLPLQSFFDEMVKIASSLEAQRQRALKMVNYHFSQKSGPDKWDKFSRNVASPFFVTQLEEHPESDEKLIEHAYNMHQLSKGTVLKKMRSSRGEGLTYEVRKLPNGRLGCTCPDWRFKGSINPEHECKHIKAYKEGR